MKRPAEVASAAVALLVAVGLFTQEEGKVLDENAAILTLVVGAVAPVVTAFVSRFRKRGV